MDIKNIQNSNQTPPGKPGYNILYSNNTGIYLKDIYGTVNVMLSFAGYSYHIVGGFHAPGSTSYTGVQENLRYDSFQSWVTKTQPLEARYYPTGGNIDYKGYYITGRDASVTYDLDTDMYTWDSWTNMTSIPSPGRFLATSISIRNYIYVAYGYNGSSYLNDNDAYTPDAWVSKTSGPTPTAYARGSFKFADSKGLWCQGYNGSLLSDVDEYNTLTDGWTARTNTASTGFVRSGAPYSDGDKGFAMLGQNSGGRTTEALMWSDTSDTWTTKTSASSPGRQGVGAILYDDDVYVTGGNSASTTSENIHEKYTYVTDSWSDEIDIPGTSRWSQATFYL